MTIESGIQTDSLPKKSTSLNSMAITVVGLAIGIAVGVCLMLPPSAKSSAKSVKKPGKQNFIQWLVGYDSSKSFKRGSFKRDFEIPEIKFGNEVEGANISDFNW